MPLPESVNCFSNRGKIALECSFHVSPVLVKIHSAVMAVLVSTADCPRGVLHQRRLHRPPEGINRTHDQHWHSAVPTSVDQNSSSILRRERLKCPRGVCAKLGWHAQFAKYGARLLIARDDQCVFAIAAAHFRH